MRGGGNDVADIDITAVCGTEVRRSAGGTWEWAEQANGGGNFGGDANVTWRMLNTLPLPSYK